MSLFDGLSKSVFSICTEIMGSSASWTPLAGGGPKTGRVLFKAPSHDRALMMGIAYSDLRPEAEWYEGTFPGLKESVDQHKKERITIDGVRYWVHSVKRAYDGRDYVAELQEDKT